MATAADFGCDGTSKVRNGSLGGMSGGIDIRAGEHWLTSPMPIEALSQMVHRAESRPGQNESPALPDLSRIMT
jgi:hypothetical protein